ncbi:hypothetical protein Psta_1088 [Pirellula staleyi DSM 6068]|uniref:Uncharacterized protein n=1 Tax=Pirellula staleyi (strain ATCC 27377 / DSM 6068 / ICPB 4128) TaxID=530564 RepID=D2R8F4_PIRSD|nr:hypothetical protein [Pirellula staleyi]ADB15771.1 hypothetical protein Psta_1088 [Pirellula staleyi DSM 6068]
MQKLLAQMWNEEDGVLSFEWTMLASLLTIGTVAGLAAVRDSVIDEMGDVAQAMVTLDQSYYIQPPLSVTVHTVGNNGYYGPSGAASSQFVDAAQFEDCGRADTRRQGGMKITEFPRSAQNQNQPGVVDENIPQ